MDKQRSGLEQQRQKLLDLYLDGLVSWEDYSARKAEIEAKLADLEQNIEDSSGLPQIDEALVARSVNAFAEQVRGKLATMGPEQMRVFLLHFLNEITYDWQRGEARLVGHIPPSNEGQFFRNYHRQPHTCCTAQNFAYI